VRSIHTPCDVYTQSPVLSTQSPVLSIHNRLCCLYTIAFAVYTQSLCCLYTIPVLSIHNRLCCLYTIPVLSIHNRLCCLIHNPCDVYTQPLCCLYTIACAVYTQSLCCLYTIPVPSIHFLPERLPFVLFSLIFPRTLAAPLPHSLFHFYPRAEVAVLPPLFSLFFCFCSDVSPYSCTFSVSHQRVGFSFMLQQRNWFSENQ
jgi:hypothetical protein